MLVLQPGDLGGREGAGLRQRLEHGGDEAVGVELFGVAEETRAEKPVLLMTMPKAELIEDTRRSA